MSLDDFNWQEREAELARVETITPPDDGRADAAAALDRAHNRGERST